MKSFLSLVLLAGASQAVKLKNRINNNSHGFTVAAEAGLGTSHNCQYSINRIKSDVANYTSIIASGTQYTDTLFPATSEMIRWNDYPGSYNLATYASGSQFARVWNLNSASTLVSSPVTSFDIVQGQDADCYFDSPSADEANLGLMTPIWLTKNFNA
jgi:hypothetical protein